MHGVERSPKPDFFDAIRCRYDNWGELYGPDGAQVRLCRDRRPAPCCRAHLNGLDGEGIRQEIRNMLRGDFSGMCGYCEQDCASIVTAIEHFRPRAIFPDEWITWLNLVYACQRCDERKGDKWPGPPGDMDISYSYVNPSVASAQRPAEEFFEYYIGIGDSREYEGNGVDMVPGQMMPSSNLTASDWWRASRTIEDLDLNSDSNTNTSGDERLPYLRNVYLEFLLDQIESEIGDWYDDIDTTESKLKEFSQSGQPFSSYIAAFTMSLGIQAP